MMPYTYLLLFLCLTINIQAQTPQELDDQVQEAIAPHRDNPKAFFKTLKELEASPQFDFNRSKKANFLLGYCYNTGYGTFTDIQEGNAYYRRSGALGEKDAYQMIAINYASRGTKNRAEIEDKIVVNQKGAEMGVPFCMWQLFFLHRDGDGSLKKNPEKGVKWLKEAATQGFPDACITLSRLYKKGKWVDKDVFMAFRLMKEAALQDSKSAYVGLFEYYRDGTGIGQSCTTGMEWLQKGLDENFAEAQYEKAMTYLKELCAEENDKEAEKWLRLAAAQKYKPAVLQLEQLRRYELAEKRREQDLLEQQIAAANAPNNSNNSTNTSSSNNNWTYSSAKEHYKRELSELGKLFHGSVEQGNSYRTAFVGHGDHLVRLVVNEGTAPGYYPIIKISYLDSDGESIG
ncbi:MAG: tetratricopeptide repeat protein, partial [Aureispira sp.]